MTYIIKAQRMDIVGTKSDRKIVPQNSYLVYESEDIVNHMKTLLAVAGAHGRGYKMRLMEMTEDFARFDVQLTQ